MEKRSRKKDEEKYSTNSQKKYPPDCFEIIGKKPISFEHIIGPWFLIFSRFYKNSLFCPLDFRRDFPERALFWLFFERILYFWK